MKRLSLVGFVLAILFTPLGKTETIGSPTYWDYTFSTDYTTCTETGLACFDTSGSVVFTLIPVTLEGTEMSPPCVNYGGWEEVVGMVGTYNGKTVSFTPQDISSCGVDQLFLQGVQAVPMRPAIATTVNFEAGGVEWQIFAPDLGPYRDSVLIGDLEGNVSVINWELTPVSTSEPASVSMVVIGLLFLFLMPSILRSYLKGLRSHVGGPTH